jgi:hypothetical protein
VLDPKLYPETWALRSKVGQRQAKAHKTAKRLFCRRFVNPDWLVMPRRRYWFFMGEVFMDWYLEQI